MNRFITFLKPRLLSLWQWIEQGAVTLYQGGQTYRGWVWGISSCVVFFCVLWGFGVVDHHRHPEDKRTSSLSQTHALASLKALDTRLQALTEQVAQIGVALKTHRLAQEPLSDNVKGLANTVDTLKTPVAETDKRTQWIQTQLRTQVSGLHDTLAQLKTDVHGLRVSLKKPPELPASLLPFTVSHVDTIQGQPVVTVTYHHQSVPLIMGESLAGFRLTDAQFEGQEAVFANAHHQQVHVALAHTPKEEERVRD